MGTKVIINPKTGKMETVDDFKCSPEFQAETVKQTRKALRDMLDGNTQFHTDTLGPDKPKEEEPKKEQQYEDGSSYEGFYGYGIHP